MGQRRSTSALTVIAALAVLLPLIAGCSSPSAKAAAPAATVTASSPAVSTSPTSSLTQQFTSPQNHYVISYPSGWKVRPATSTWPYGQGETTKTDDVLRAADGSGWRITSQTIPAGMTGQQWLRKSATHGPVPSNTLVCFPKLARYRPTVIDGHQAWVHGGMSPCNFTEAVVVVGPRAYKFTAQPSLDHWTSWVYNSTTFNQMLASVHVV